MSEKYTEKRIIFVLGNPRSGTRMMGRILGNHSSVYMFRELNYFEKLWASKNIKRRLSVSEALHFGMKLFCVESNGIYLKGNQKKFKKHAQQFYQDIGFDELFPIRIYENFLRYITAFNNKHIPCEQTPRYVYHIREILESFPDAKIINMVRDPRDVLLSHKNMWKRHFLGKKKKPLKITIRYWMAYHPISTSTLWNAAFRTANRFISDRRLISVKFEDILDNPEGEIKKICDFIGISYNQGMLDVPQTGSSLIPDRFSYTGVDKNRRLKWKNGGLNSAELYICQAITANNMAKLGYKLVKIYPNLVYLIFHIITFPIKSIAFLILQLNQIKSFKEFMMRRIL